ncbi:MAG: phosphatase PAP2 family protein [Desulfarculaceae bacterium]|nr:phosphatase PAP2 family protein [Desulfarculaceae bacterium]MCF8072022.1 phosphatase PAP2 family protein [Desulfarculaceae bacterium]MCF8101539.1 phosphatase PAP2 family protein [Desulfarculaceae bacterium]MCF8115089.1 phosphatase PAP2 family protein [Desulfarculaceae bacterium]
MDRRLLKITCLTGLAVAALTVLLFWFVDRPIAFACHRLAGGALFNAATYVSLLADHGFHNVWLFCGLVLGGVLALGRGLTPGVRGLLYVCLTVVAAMLIGETLKWFFGRYRPVMLFDKGLYGFSWFAAKGWAHSFPSGHNFRIFSALTALGLLWPKARWPLWVLAGMVGVSRVIVTRHFPSDIVAGAFLGIVCALWAWRIMQGGRTA